MDNSTYIYLTQKKNGNKTFIPYVPLNFKRTIKSEHQDLTYCNLVQLEKIQKT